MDFTFFTSNDCTTGGTAAGTDIVLDASGVAHPSSSEGPLGAGTYSFQAIYKGDDNYKTSTRSVSR